MFFEALKVISAWSAAVLELIGIAIIMLVTLYATFKAVIEMLKGETLAEAFRFCRLRISRSILMGLEFLVAADIIDTVAVEPNFNSVGVLGLIVAIRTFLSFTLEVEIAGRWPWYPPVAASQDKRRYAGAARP
jgi:uncharacterized membrane protein